MTNRPKAYLKQSCPHCLKLRIFLTEAGQADRFEYIIFHDGDDTHRALRERMQAAGQEPSFPAVEYSPPVLETGTDDIIAKIAVANGIDTAYLPLLAYYQDGVFGQYIAMFRELKALRKE